MDDFLLRESLSPQAAEFLKACVTARVNLVISGGTSAGFELEEVFVFDVKGFRQDGALEGTLRYTGARPKFVQKFQLNHVEVPSWVVT